MADADAPAPGPTRWGRSAQLRASSGSGPPSRTARPLPDSPQALADLLRGVDYIASEALATAVFLAVRMGKPLLLEGLPGVGKTEAAKALASCLARQVIRLQCYEGIDAANALYEWNYPRQLLAIRQAGERDLDLYTPEYLIERPLLRALRQASYSVLLLDEIDRADQEFEAYLLEFLADFQISIPELGTQSSAVPPLVVLTSNRTRELHEALRRRCVYHWIDYPSPEQEAQIIALRAGEVARATAQAVVAAVNAFRAQPLAKPPGIAEAVDWARAATLLAAGGLPWPLAFRRAIGLALKDEDDLAISTAVLDEVMPEQSAETAR
ncbi:MAG: AAA domain-containing protein [Gammaproteobacteria bacterium]|nr:AAA domain-containing protein [Gammaproteobacteria bacterium]NKC11679.1 AAA domain-containing protein [Gammaproteobacteria bacterium]